MQNVFLAILLLTMICNADKGGAVVIMVVKDYVKEAERQLLDPTFYKKIEENAT